MNPRLVKRNALLRIAYASKDPDIMALIGNLYEVSGDDARITPEIFEQLDQKGARNAGLGREIAKTTQDRAMIDAILQRENVTYTTALLKNPNITYETWLKIVQQYSQKPKQGLAVAMMRYAFSTRHTLSNVMTEDALYSAYLGVTGKDRKRRVVTWLSKSRDAKAGTIIAGRFWQDNFKKTIQESETIALLPYTTQIFRKDLYAKLINGSVYHMGIGELIGALHETGVGDDALYETFLIAASGKEEILWPAHLNVQTADSVQQGSTTQHTATWTFTPEYAQKIATKIRKQTGNEEAALTIELRSGVGDLTQHYENLSEGARLSAVSGRAWSYQELRAVGVMMDFCRIWSNGYQTQKKFDTETAKSYVAELVENTHTWRVTAENNLDIYEYRKLLDGALGVLSIEDALYVLAQKDHVLGEYLEAYILRTIGIDEKTLQNALNYLDVLKNATVQEWLILTTM